MTVRVQACREADHRPAADKGCKDRGSRGWRVDKLRFTANSKSAGRVAVAVRGLTPTCRPRTAGGVRGACMHERNWCASIPRRWGGSAVAPLVWASDPRHARCEVPLAMPQHRDISAEAPRPARVIATPVAGASVRSPTQSAAHRTAALPAAARAATSAHQVNPGSDSIAGIGASLLGYASVAAMLHQVAIAQGMCARVAAERGRA